MKELREGVSTGSCMTGGAEASVIWQTTGKCPSVVKVETPIGKRFIWILSQKNLESVVW